MSALAVMAGAGYAFAYGIASIPPFVALFLVGALATVLFRLAEMLRRRLNNIVTSALSAVTLMISMLSSIALIGWLLIFVLSGERSPVTRFLAATDVANQIMLGFVLALNMGLAILAVMQIVTLYTILQANAFGRRHSSATGEEEV